MKEEKMKVLEMLENGKISADEAARLLEALNVRKISHVEFDENMSDFSRKVSEFAKEFSEKVAEAYKAVQPKVKEVTKTVVSKTADVAENISKSLNESIKNFEEDCDCESDNDVSDGDDTDKPVEN